MSAFAELIGKRSALEQSIEVMEAAGTDKMVTNVMREQLARGQTVCIFPEGTTFSGDEVRPFHPGAFLAAGRLDVDIVPVGLAYAAGSDVAFRDETFGQHLSRVAASPGTRVVVSVGAPLHAPNGARPAVVAEAARAAVEAEVKRARSRDAFAGSHHVTV